MAFTWATWYTGSSVHCNALRGLQEGRDLVKMLLHEHARTVLVLLSLGEG